MNVINLYSYLLVAAAVVLVAAVVLLRHGLRLRNVAALAAIVLGVIISWYIARPGASTPASIAEVEATLSSGNVVLLEFQSEF